MRLMTWWALSISPYLWGLLASGGSCRDSLSSLCLFLFGRLGGRQFEAPEPGHGVPEDPFLLLPLLLKRSLGTSTRPMSEHDKASRLNAHTDSRRRRRRRSRRRRGRRKGRRRRGGEEKKEQEGD